MAAIQGNAVKTFPECQTREETGFNTADTPSVDGLLGITAYKDTTGTSAEWTSTHTELIQFEH